MTLPISRRAVVGLLAGGLGLKALPLTAEENQIDASQFGVSASNPNNREAFQAFIDYLAETGAVGTIGPGFFAIEGSLTVLPEGPVAIKGSGKGKTVISGKGKNFLQVRGDMSLSHLSVKGFDFHIACMGPGDINISNCSFENGKGFLKGKIEAQNLFIADNTLKNFSSFGLFSTKAVVTQKAVFAGNTIRNIARYLYRVNHAAPLYFEGNDIDGITSGTFKGNAGVARVILRGGSTTYIRNNIIKNVIASDASSTLLYWSGVNAVITGNTFGKFASGKRAVLVHEKDSSSKYLVLSDNVFLGGDDLAEFDAVVYSVTGGDENPSPKIIERNRGIHLSGKLVQILHQKHHKVPPGNFIIKHNRFNKLDAPALVSIIQGAKDLVVSDNIIGNMSNPQALPITGTAVVKCLIGVNITSEYGVVDNVHTQNNSITFSNDGEIKPRKSSLYYMRVFSRGTPQQGSWTSIGDKIFNPDNVLKLATIPSGHIRMQNTEVTGLRGETVIGTPTSLQGLS